MIARHSALVSTLAPVIAWVSDKATSVLLACSVVGKPRYLCIEVEATLPSAQLYCDDEVMC